MSDVLMAIDYVTCSGVSPSSVDGRRFDEVLWTEERFLSVLFCLAFRM